VEPEPVPRAGRTTLLLSLALVLALAAVYARTGGHAFLTYDDGLYVTENPHVLGGLSWAGLRAAFLGFHGGNWHPLTVLSHQLDVSLFGLDAGAHHLVNAALHALNAALCLVVLARATGNVWAAALVAALFALHPLRVESVAWVAERKDVLAGTFFFLTLLAHVARVRRPTRAGGALVALCLALGLLAKPMLVTLPCLLLVLDRWPLARREPWSALVREKSALFLLALVSAVLTVVAQRAGGSLQALDQLTLAERGATAVRAVWTYLAQSLWPVDLAPFYPHPALVPGAEFAPLGARTWLALALLAGVTLCAWALRARRPALLAGWLWFLGMLVPVAGLVQVGLQLHADRYTYLPGIGLAVALVYGLGAGLGPRAARSALALGGVVALACGVASARQVARWRDTRTLFEHALALDARNHVAHQQLGLQAQREGDLVRAREHYRAALAIHPQLTGTLGNLGAVHATLGERAEARAAFAALHALLPDDLQGRLGLAALAQEEGRPADAVRLLEGVRAGTPGFGLAMLSLAEAQEARGEWRAALAAYERSFEDGIDPGAAAAAAWILATGPDPALLDGARARELAQLAAEGGAPNALEVQAAAAARAGDFAAAVALQGELLRQSPDPTQRFLQGQRLELYRSGKPYTRR